MTEQSAQEKPGFKEYPITLAHPAFQASKPIPVPGSQIYDRQGNITRQDYRGTPERYGPVTAGSEAEEEYYRAQGYERAGKMDPSAWVRAHADAPSADYQPQKYPMWRDGVLILTAQEDPDASDDDLRAPEYAPAVVAAEPETEAANLRAQMAEMNATMAHMMETMKAQADELAKRSEGAATAPARAVRAAPRGPGRPRKATG